MSDSWGDNTGQHADGIQHITANSDASRASESSNGSMLDTVKSYLGMGGSQAGETGTAAEDNTSGSGSGAGVAGAAATAASAAGLGSGNSAAGGGLGSTSSASGAAADDTTGSASSTGGAGSTLETAKEKVQETVANTVGGDAKPVTSGDSDHKPPQAAGGRPKKMENESAIPTAGGERLGEKHWGESKIVPENPETPPNEAGISSEAGSAGQPTQQTTDNTAKNTGGATGPPGSTSNDSSGSNDGGKEKITDKIKDKLHIGKKE